MVTPHVPRAAVSCAPGLAHLVATAGLLEAFHRRHLLKAALEVSGKLRSRR